MRTNIRNKEDAFNVKMQFSTEKHCSSSAASLCSKIRDDISFLLLVTGIMATVGAVCLTFPELPTAETAGQLLWVARGCIVFSVCVLLSLILRTSSYNFPGIAEITSWILIGLAGIQAVWGLQQVYGFANSNHSQFLLTGSFFNPGPYSGYLAMILPISLYEWLRLNTQTTRTFLEHAGYYVSLVVLILVICVLPIGMSRSAWVAALVSCGWVLYKHFAWKEKTIVQWRNHRKRMIGAMAGVFFLMFLCVAVLFFSKKDSANGRLFIWKISTIAIHKNPFGYGVGSFPRVYGDAQEAYFAQGAYTEREEHVAGSPEYAFNEYLHIALEWGLPTLALLLFLVVLSLCVTARNGHIGVCAAIVSVLVFSFSSYPFASPAFVSGFLLLLTGSVTRNHKARIAVLALVACFFGLYFLKTNSYDSCVRWRNCRVFYQTEAYDVAIKEYSFLYPKLKKRPAFLYEYGHACHKNGDYEQSTKILLEAAQHSCDPMIFNVIGKNYQQLKQFEKAEQWFWRAANRLPGRIYPYYLLAKLYSDPEYYREEKLKEMIHLVLTKEPKVQSTAVRQMREEIENLLVEFD